MNFPRELKFVSLLQYSPRGLGARGGQSKTVTYAIKTNGAIILTDATGAKRSVNAVDWALDALLRSFDKYPCLQQCFGPDVTLVPMPRSAPLKASDALWPGMRICQGLLARKCAGDVAQILERTTPVQRAAYAAREGRPRPEPPDHYASTCISQQQELIAGRKITLVDDVITRGSSFVGMVPHVHAAFPDAEVRCFAVVRTESSGAVERIIAPVEGMITYRNGWLQRVP